MKKQILILKVLLVATTLVSLVLAEPETSPFQIYEDFEGILSVVLENAVASGACQTLRGTQHALFNGASTRRLTMLPREVKGDLRINFYAYSGEGVTGAGCGTAGSPNALDFQEGDTGFGDTGVSVSPVDPEFFEEAFFSGALDLPLGTALFLTQDASGASEPIIAIDNLDVQCVHHYCVIAAADAAVNTTWSDDWNGSSDAIASVALDDSAQTCPNSATTGILGSADGSNEGLEFGAKVACDCSGTCTEREAVSTQIDLSAGGMLQFELFVSDTSCPDGVDTPTHPDGLTYCDFRDSQPPFYPSNQNLTGGFDSPVFFNEIRGWMNRELDSLSRTDFATDATTSPCNDGSNFVANCRYRYAGSSATVDNCRGCGFEVAGTAGLDISGYEVVAIAATGTQQLEGVPSSDSWNDQAEWYILDEWTFPDGSILLPVNRTAVEDAREDHHAGYLTVAYNFRREAACMFAAYDSDTSQPFRGSWCSLMLFNPGRTELLNRMVWGSPIVNNGENHADVDDDDDVADRNSFEDPFVHYVSHRMVVGCEKGAFWECENAIAAVAPNVVNMYTTGGTPGAPPADLTACDEVDVSGTDLDDQTIGGRCCGAQGVVAAANVEEDTNDSHRLFWTQMGCSRVGVMMNYMSNSVPDLWAVNSFGLFGEDDGEIDIWGFSSPLYYETSGYGSETNTWIGFTNVDRLPGAPSLFSTNDLAIQASLPLKADGEFELVGGACRNFSDAGAPNYKDFLHNAAGVTYTFYQIFDCNELSTYDTSGCCGGAATAGNPVLLEARASELAEWEALRRFDSTGGGWELVRVPVPARLRTTTAQFRWSQPIYAQSQAGYVMPNPERHAFFVPTGTQTWAIDSIEVYNTVPVAWGGGFALLLSDDETVLLEADGFHSAASSNNEVTVELWLRASGVPSSATTVLSISNHLLLQVNSDGSLCYEVQNGAFTLVSVCSAGAALAADQWTKATFVVGGGTRSISTSRGANGPAPVTVSTAHASGVSIGGSTITLTGEDDDSIVWQFDELAVWDSARSDAHDLFAHLRVLGADDMADASLRGYWSMNAGSCGRIVDDAHRTFSNEGQTAPADTVCAWVQSTAEVRTTVYLDSSSQVRVAVPVIGTDVEDAEADYTYNFNGISFSSNLNFGALYVRANSSNLQLGAQITGASSGVSAPLGFVYVLLSLPDFGTYELDDEFFRVRLVDSGGEVSATAHVQIAITEAAAVTDTRVAPPTADDVVIYYLTETVQAPSPSGLAASASTFVHKSGPSFGTPAPTLTVDNALPSSWTLTVDDFYTALHERDEVRYVNRLDSGGLESAQASLVFVRRLPFAYDDVASAAGGVATPLLNLTANDYALDADRASGMTIVANATSENGASIVAHSALVLVYTAPRGFTGVDTFYYALEVGGNRSNVAMVSVSVTSDASVSPVATAAIGNEDADILVELRYTGSLPAEAPPGTAPLFRIDTLPTQGTLYDTADGVTRIGPITSVPYALPNNLTIYVPDADYNGGDTFDFDVSDRFAGWSLAPATVNVTVLPQPDAPDARDSTEAVAQLSPRAPLPLDVFDADGDTPLTVLIIAFNGAPSGAPGRIFDGAADITASLPATLSAVAAFEYEPPSDGQVGIALESVEFAVRDPGGLWSTVNGTLTIDVLPPSTEPQAFDVFVCCNQEEQDVVVQFDVFDFDNPGDVVYYVASLPASGDIYDTLVGSGSRGAQLFAGQPASGSQVIYAPNTDFAGNDTFHYYADDLATASANATVTVQVLNVNDAPTMSERIVAIGQEDIAFEFTLDGAEVDGGDSLEFTLIDLDSLEQIELRDLDCGGALVPLNATPYVSTCARFGVTPLLNYNGNQTLRALVEDASGAPSDPVTVVHIVVMPVNDAPTAIDLNVTASEGTVSVPITFDSSDPDFGDSVVYRLAALPAQQGAGARLFNTSDGVTKGVEMTTVGALFSGAQAIYEAPPDFVGVDTLRFEAVDGDGEVSVPAGVVRISLTPVNDAPTATATAHVVAEGATFVALSLDGADVDAGDTLTYTLATPPDVSAPGSAYSFNSSAGVLVYSAPARGLANDYSGPAPWTTFSWSVVDQDGAPSAQVTDNITVTSVNDPPTAAPFTLRILQGASVDFFFTAHVGDPDTPSVPSEATPDIVFDRLLFGGESIALTCVAPACPAIGDGATRPLTTEFRLDAGGAAAFIGIVHVEYHALDAGGLSSPARNLTLTIGNVNDPPTANDLTVSTLEEVPVAFNLNATDPDSSALVYVVTSVPAVGTLRDANGDVVRADLVPYAQANLTLFTYTPPRDFYGSTSFTYVANDTQVGSSVATVTLLVDNVNDPPVPVDVFEPNVLEATPFVITLTATDVDPANGFQFAVATLPRNGTMRDASSALVSSVPHPLPIGTATLTYTGDVNFAGFDTFLFDVADNSSAPNAAAESRGIVALLVATVDSPPLANDVVLSIAENTATASFSLAGSDSDTPTSLLEARITSLPSNGELRVAVRGAEEVATVPLPVEPDNNMVLRYTPAANWHGNDTFHFVLFDGVTESAEATVRIEVTAVDVGPTVADVRVVVIEDTLTRFNLSASDADSDAIASIRVAGALGTLGAAAVWMSADNATATFEYTPPPHVVGRGVDSARYWAVDARGMRSAANATVYFDVSPRNDLPASARYEFNATLGEVELVPLRAADPLDTNDGVTLPRLLRRRITAVPAFGLLTNVANDNVTLLDNITASGTWVSNRHGLVAYGTHPLGEKGDALTTIEYLAVDPQTGYTAAYGEVVLNVIGTNEPPDTSANPTIAIVAEDTRVLMRLFALDPNENDLLTFYIESQPGNGVLRQALPGGVEGAIIAVGQPLVSHDGDVFFTPEPNFHCPDDSVCLSFAYSVDDGTVPTRVPGNAGIRVTAQNDPPEVTPEFADQDFRMLEDGTLVLRTSLWVSDIDGDELRFRATSPPNGRIESYDSTSGLVLGPATGAHAGDSLLFTPNADENDETAILTDGYFAVFTWEAFDGIAASVPARIGVNVVPVNDPPVVFATRVSTRESKPVTVSLTGTDPEQDDFAMVISRMPGKGRIYQFDESNPPSFFGAPISFSGTQLLDSRFRLVYDPPSGRSASPFTNFEFKGDDGKTNGLSSPGADVEIDVLPNNAPQALPQSVRGTEDENLVVALRGIDPDGDSVTAKISSLPLFGRLFQWGGNDDTRGSQITIADEDVTDTVGNRVIYVPLKNQFGENYDEFGFKVFDGNLISKQDAKVEVSVDAAPDAPLVNNITLPDAEEDVQLILILNGQDFDGAKVKMFAWVLSLPRLGQLFQNSEGNRRAIGEPITEVPTQLTDPKNKMLYVPAPNAVGDDSFSFRVIDATDRPSGVAWVAITLNAVADAPVSHDIEVVAIPGISKLVQLNATDVDDGDQEKLIYEITRLPDPSVASLFQVGNSRETLEQIVFVPFRVLNDEALVAVVAKVGNTTGSFSYRANDGLLDSDEATVTFGIGADPSSSDGGSSAVIFAAAGAAAGAAVLYAIIAFVWWRKRVARRRHSVAGALVQRKSSKEILEKLLMEEGFHVVKALADAIEITEADEVAGALVRLFVANGQIMPLLQTFISKEVRDSKNPSTLFRGNSLASKMMKAYSRMIGLGYLNATLPTLIAEVLDNAGAYEVDKRKLGDDEEALDANWERLMDTTQRFFEAIVDSLDACPAQFRVLCAYLHAEVTDHFPDYHNVHTFIGGFLFLRFFCPAIVAPESYGLADGAPSMASRRGLVLVSKGVQNLSNGVQFGSKEEYMMPMNQFIVSNLHKVRQFLDAVAELPENLDAAPDAGAEAVIEGAEKAEALDVLHRHLFVNQNEISDKLAALDTGEGDRDYLEHLAALDLAVSYAADHVEEVTEVLVSDMPLVFAICATVGNNVEAAKAIITVFEAHGLTVNLLEQLVDREIKAATSANMLLRGNSTALRMTKAYVENIGVPYLQQVLAVTVRLIVQNPRGYEIDPSRLQNAAVLQENAEHLASTCDEFVNNIFGSVASFPIQIRVLCRYIHDTVASSQFAERRFTVLADFVFSRLICPAIVTPLAYGIVDDQPSGEASRALLLVTKTLQHLAHGTTMTSSRLVAVAANNSDNDNDGEGRDDEQAPKAVVSNKETYLNIMSRYIKENVDGVQEYLEKLIDVDLSAAEDAQSFLITNELLRSSVATVHNSIVARESDIRAELTPDSRTQGALSSRLVAILADLGPPLQQ
jgi:GTPase-activator protein for Ras-like GTPase/Bacterial Ig domain/Concanavalin A-like lectin/glucanases superfamily